MARISGVDLPREKRVEIALTYIYGIGRKTASDIIAATGVNPDNCINSRLCNCLYKLAVITNTTSFYDTSILSWCIS